MKRKKIVLGFAVLFLILAFAGFFYSTRENLSKIGLLKAAVGFLSYSDDKEVQMLKLSLEETRSGLEVLQEENYSLKEKLELEKEIKAELELKYELELENLAGELEGLVGMIDDFNRQINELTLLLPLEEDSLEQEVEEELEKEELEEKKDDFCFININTASKEELEKITGIGSVIAQRIIEARLFSSIYNLTRVSGIGEATLQKIIDQGCAYVENDIGPSITKPVFSSGDGGVVSKSQTEQGCAKNSIEINTASQEELEMLQGVGATTAKNIIKARPFFSLDDLIKASGIGEAKLEDIKNQGCVYVDKSLLPPSAIFFFSPENPFVGQEILFQAFSGDFGSAITTYIWDFGDGNSVSTSLATTSYSFLNSGQFLITLLVVDNQEAVSFPATTTINIINLPQPILEVSSTTLSFRGEEEQSISSQFIVIENKGNEELSWIASTTTDWLSIVPDFGTILAFSSATAEISVNASDLSAGNYQATTTIEAPGAQNSPQEISIFLEISEEPKNLLKNEFFEEWLVNFEAGPDNWEWTHLGDRIEQSSDGLVGDYSVKLILTTVSKQSFYQYGKSMAGPGDTYYAEIWAKGTGMIDFGFKNPQANSWRTSEETIINSSEWKRFTFNDITTGQGDNGGMRIRVWYDVVQDVPSGSELLIGATWLSTAPPPANWPQI